MATPPGGGNDKQPVKKSKMTDRLRKPFKKRHSAIYHQSTNRVNRYLAQAIEARSVDREKSNHVNMITLCFKEKEKEKQYHEEKDHGFGNSMTCSLAVLIFVGTFQAIVLSRTLFLVILFIIAFVWISTLLILMLGARLKCISWDISHFFLIRLATVIFTVVLVYAVAQVNVFSCASESTCVDSSVNITQAPLINDNHACPIPHYIFLSCIMTFFPIVVFLRLPIIIKGALLVPMAAVFIIVIIIIHTPIFICYGNRVGSAVPLHITGVVVIIHFLLAVLLHGRQVEWTARLDFLWNVQANEEKKEMHELQNSNRRILFNLLPAHVATHFLDNQFRNNMDLYHQSYSKVGVVFASIPNFHEFYMELDGNNQGVECLRLLNEIIADFDELLDDDRFRAIDKIKTVGSTYMAAIGLMPDFRISDDSNEAATEYMCILVEMVFTLKDKLSDINENSYNNFMLRVGVNIGPVVAGVIGARKPQYDIWGNTVNVASRMDSTGLPNHTQVTEEVFQLLKDYYVFQCRGKVKVKGKGDMTTYFLIDRKPPGTVPSRKDPQGKADITGSSTGGIPGGVPTPLSFVVPNIKQENGHAGNGAISDGNNSCKGKKVHSYSHVAAEDIVSTSSPRLPPARLPPWEPRSTCSDHPVTGDASASMFYIQPKPIIGNTPPKTYSQSRPRSFRPGSPNQNSSSTTANSENVSSVLHQVVKKNDSWDQLASGAICKPPKEPMPPKLSSSPWSAQVLKPSKEMFHFPPPPSPSPPTKDNDSIVQSSTVVVSESSVPASSSHDSLLGADPNPGHLSSLETSSLNQSASTSSCDSFVRTDFSRTDLDTPSPTFCNYATTNLCWVYPSTKSNGTKFQITPKENDKMDVFAFSQESIPSVSPKPVSESGNHCLPEVGHSPSKNVPLNSVPALECNKPYNEEYNSQNDKEKNSRPSYLPFRKDNSKKVLLRSVSENKKNSGVSKIGNSSIYTQRRKSDASQQTDLISKDSITFPSYISKKGNLSISRGSSAPNSPQDVLKQSSYVNEPSKCIISHDEIKHSQYMSEIPSSSSLPKDSLKRSSKEQGIQRIPSGRRSNRGSLQKNYWKPITNEEHLGSLEQKSLTKSTADPRKKASILHLQEINVNDTFNEIGETSSGDVQMPCGSSPMKDKLNNNPVMMRLSEKQVDANSASRGNGNIIGLHFDPLEKKMTLNLLTGNSESLKRTKLDHENKRINKDAQGYQFPLKGSSLNLPYNHKSLNYTNTKESEYENIEKNISAEKRKNVSLNNIPPATVEDDSESEESEDDEEKSSEIPLIDEQGYSTDDPALENISVMNEHGLTDAEGALSDLNSIFNDPGHEADMDDTSISSRASSRMFDSDQLLSVDSLNVMYDSEYDNYRPGMISDDDIFHPEPISDIDIGYLDEPSIENIRTISNNITKNFGQPHAIENDDSEAG